MQKWFVAGLLILAAVSVSIVVFSRRSEDGSEASLERRTMNSERREKKGPQRKISALASRLMTRGYIALLQGPDEDALDAVWNEPSVPEALATMATDPEAPALARFLAAEIVFCKQKWYPSQEQKRRLASVYATALAQNFTEAANTWGLPGELDGLAGEHLLAFGEAAVPELATLLDDDRRVYYEGSQEATLGNSYQYRVKDLAAFYVCKIRNIPFELDEDPSKRDKEIEKLRSAAE